MASTHEQAAPGSPKLAGGTLVPSSATEKAAVAGAGASSCSLPATLSPYWYTLACWGTCAMLDQIIAIIYLFMAWG